MSLLFTVDTFMTSYDQNCNLLSKIILAERGAIKGKEWIKVPDHDGHHIVPYFFGLDFPSAARTRVRKALHDFNRRGRH